ncbi:erythromycin esterase family protein [Streptomycetaceae bacterium NBC_01309]
MPSSVVTWIEEQSYAVDVREFGGPLDDLRPMAPMLRDATVVALGAAARHTRELSVAAHRVVRLLVEHEGFRSVALEGDDPARLGLDVYIATGAGDPRELLSQARVFWQTREILDLVGWMRSYNLLHPDDPVRFAEPAGAPVEHGIRLDGLAGVERTLADGVLSWLDRTGDKIVYWGGSAHTAVGDPRTVSPSEPAETHRNMGGYLRRSLGEGYRSVGLTLGRGADGLELPAPGAHLADAVLDEAARGRPAYLLDLRAARPEPVRRWLDAPTRTRLVGPFYEPAEDHAHHLSGGSLSGWFDAVVHISRVTPGGPLPPSKAERAAGHLGEVTGAASRRQD